MKELLCYCSILVLLGCSVPKDVQLQQLVDADELDHACTKLKPFELEDSAVHDSIEQAIANETEVELSMEVVPVAAFTHPPEGYGTSWWIVNAGLAQQGPAEGVRLAVTVPGWSYSPLTQEWMRKHWPEPAVDARKEPELEGSTSSEWTGIPSSTRMLGALLALPFVAAADFVMGAADIHDGKASNMPYLTPHVAKIFAEAALQTDLDAEVRNLKSAMSGGVVARPSLGSLAVSDGGLMCQQDLCATRLVFHKSSSTRASVRGRVWTESCVVDVRGTEALAPAEGGLPEVLLELFPPTGRTIRWRPE